MGEQVGMVTGKVGLGGWSRVRKRDVPEIEELLQLP